MYQRTALFRDINELKEELPNIEAEFCNYEDGVIGITIANIPEEDVCALQQLLAASLPKFKLNGISSSGIILYHGSDYQSIIYLSLTGMTESKSTLFSKRFDDTLKNPDSAALEYAKELREEIKNIPDLKGVEIYFAGLKASVGKFLEVLSDGLEDVPVFGSIANSNSIDFLKGYVTLSNDDAIVINNDFTGPGISTVVYSGKNLYLYSEYLFGWKPIGKYMDVCASDTTSKGKTVVYTIDNEKSTDIYYRYLGIKPNKSFVTNISEFPLIIERNGTYLGRTPSGYDENGSVYLNGDIRQGETVRFSYGDYEEILVETRNAAGRMAAFEAESLSLIICGNRFNFLQKDYKIEVEYYSEGRSGLPYLILGMGEIYRYHGKGGVLNSALVAIGMREGLGDKSYTNLLLPKVKHVHDGIIPLHERLSHFLNAMTGELINSVNEAKIANEAKSTFLSNMSHEIRTPINAVLGMDEMILRECNEKNILDYAQNIKVAGNTLLSLVNDILDFSKIEAGKMDIINVDYDLSSVINDLVNMIKPRIDAKGLELIIDIDKDIPSVMNGDEIRIKQVITNILTNAVKYTEKGSVTLKINSNKADANSTDLSVSIQDTGIGIKKEDIEKMFVAFQRVDEKRNRNIEGTGLGLDITRRLLSLMGTSLEVESEYGKGSDFHFTIRQTVIKWDPVGDYMSTLKKSLEQKKDYREKFTAPDCHVLVVDDTPMNLTVFEGLLKKTRINIDRASSGKECLEKSRIKKYDIIFLDHRMPEMDGIETFHRLKLEGSNPNRSTVIISLTANAVSGAREQYIEAGFDDYLTKPIISDKLESLLMQYLPKDKLHIIDDEPDEAESAPELPEWVMNIDNLDVNAGIANCGSVDVFLNAVVSFMNSAEENLSLIDEYVKEHMLKDYTIKVHALKSSSRIIGASQLSHLAEELEAAGDAEDVNTILAKTPELIKIYKDLAQKLSNGKQNSETDLSDLPLIDKATLDEALASIKELSTDFDYDSVKYIMDSLSKYRIPEESITLFEQLKTAIAHADWDEINKVFSE